MPYTAHGQTWPARRLLLLLHRRLLIGEQQFDDLPILQSECLQADDLRFSRCALLVRGLAFPGLWANTHPPLTHPLPAPLI